MSKYQRERIKVLIGGIASLMLMMGVARFAYTPLLPVMQVTEVLNNSQGAWLTTANYIGYLLGAWLSAVVGNFSLKHILFRAGVVVAVATTAAMALTDNVYLWAILRFFSGLSTAAGLLMGTSLALNWLIRHQFRGELGVLMSGNGIGIVLVSILVMSWADNYDWSSQWLLLGVIAIVLAIFAWAWVPSTDNAHQTTQGKTLVDVPPDKVFFRWFMLAYFCAGVGFVVGATFVPALIAQQPLFAEYAGVSFLVLGVFVAPAPILADYLARKHGVMTTLVWMYVVKTFGIALFVLWSSIIGYFIGTAIFGFTFIGIVSLTLSMAGKYYPSAPNKMMGKMTIAYGIAQVVAPTAMALYPQIEQGYEAGFWLATAVMLIGTVALISVRNKA